MSSGTGLDADDVVDADSLVVAGSPAPSERIPLDRRRIVLAAVAFIDANGLPALSMRRLGALLGVEAMSLYQYVSGRENLLDGVVDAIIDEMYEDDDVLASPKDGWQDFLQRLAHGVRRVALAHPKAFPLVASRPPEAPWLRPPLRSLRVVEDFLTTLISHGFDDDRAVQAYRAFSGFLLGHLLLEATLLGADAGPAEEPLDEGGSDVPNADQKLDLDAFPQILRLEARLSEDHAAAEFEQALEDLLDRLDRFITE